MIIFGSRMYFRRNVVNVVGECEHCGAYGKLASYQAKKFGHIYFIPLIPLGAHSQILRECAFCEMGAHIPLTKLKPMVDSVAGQFQSWVIAIQEGKSELVPEGGTEPVNIGILIAGLLEDLYCLKEIEDIQSISTILKANDLEYEHEMVMGRWWQMQGDLQQAASCYQAAHKLRPEEPLPHFQMGFTHVKLGNTPAAEEAFAKYTNLCPDDVSPYIELAGLYENKNDYANIVTTYDKIYALNPDVIPNKGMRKIYKKACKKSGQQGKYLEQM